jgi:CRP-like cAMP-binding protein
MKKLYSFNDEPRCAYLLKSGTVFFEIRDKELYKIAGKNLIVAASEILLNFNPDSLYYRGYNFYRDDAAEIAEISPGNLRTLVYKYTAGYNINVFFAQMIQITNKILAKRRAELTDDAKVVHEISKIYYEITNVLVETGEKLRFPDIKKLAEKQKSELIYETGKIFSHGKEPKQIELKKEMLDDFNVSFPSNSIICNEGDEGREMYILNRGRIKILVSGSEVAEINEPGTVIGEIALLLGEKRTATLKAVDQVVLSVVKKDNLRQFHQANENIFLQMGTSLSKSIHNNFQIIRNIDGQAKEKKEQKVAGFLDRGRAQNHILELSKNMDKLYSDKGYKQLPDLIKKAGEAIKKYVR